MARSVSRTRIVNVETYVWPESQLILWRFIMIGTGGTLIGIFASFIEIQQQLQQGIPWIMSYGVTVGALTIVFILIAEILLNQKNLQPGMVIIGSFILFVLYLAGMIETAIELFGSTNSINSLCNNYINAQSSKGPTIETLAFLEQRSICQSWDAVFAFWIVGAVFLVWAFFMSMQVNRRANL